MISTICRILLPIRFVYVHSISCCTQPYAINHSWVYRLECTCRYGIIQWVFIIYWHYGSLIYCMLWFELRCLPHRVGAVFVCVRWGDFRVMWVTWKLANSYCQAGFGDLNPTLQIGVKFITPIVATCMASVKPCTTCGECRKECIKLALAKRHKENLPLE